MLAISLFQRLGIRMPRAQPARLDRQPAIHFLVLIPLEDKVSVLPRVKVSQLREAFLHLFEKVQDRVPVAGQIHLGIEVNVDIKVVGVANVAIHTGDPEYLRKRRLNPRPQPNRKLPPAAIRRVGDVDRVVTKTPLYHNQICHEMNGRSNKRSSLAADHWSRDARIGLVKR